MDIVPGKNKAVASLVLGIIAIVCWAFGSGGIIISLVCGIIGIVMSSKAKSAGYTGGMRTGGFVCSLIGLIISGLVLLMAILLGGAIGAAIALA